MTLIIIWAVMSLIVMIALKHEIEQLRTLLKIRTPWSMTAVVLWVVFSAVTPIGMLYLWAVIKQTSETRERIRSMQHEWM